MEVRLHYTQKNLKKRKMSNPTNTYVPKFVPKYLLWYERDGLMTWYDQIKCEDFLRNVNIFRKQKLLSMILSIESVTGKKFWKIFWNTIKQLMIKVFQNIPHLIKTKSFPELFELIEKIHFFENKTIKKHFNKKIKSKPVLLRTKPF